MVGLILVVSDIMNDKDITLNCLQPAEGVWEWKERPSGAGSELLLTER